MKKKTEKEKEKQQQLQQKNATKRNLVICGCDRYYLSMRLGGRRQALIHLPTITITAVHGIGILVSQYGKNIEYCYVKIISAHQRLKGRYLESLILARYKCCFCWETVKSQILLLICFLLFQFQQYICSLLIANFLNLSSICKIFLSFRA